MLEVRKQAVTGVVPPQSGEAIIREVWPSIAAYPGVATLGRRLTRTIVGAPVAWLMMAPFYLSKVLPIAGLAVRYTLTNRRLMIRRGMRPRPTHEVALAEIDEVRWLKDANSAFYRAGTLEVLAGGKVALRLPGTPEPESFRHSIIDACKAWVPGRANGQGAPVPTA